MIFLHWARVHINSITEKSFFKKDPTLFYDEDMTERELAEINCLERVYDSGKIRWAKSII